MNLKLKIKNNLKKEIEKEQNGGKDSRILNYYDMKDGEKMKVLLIPDINGELWAKFKKHGPNLKLPGAGSINCSYSSNGQECPACQKGFALLDQWRETGNEAYKTEAKRWFPRDYTIVSALVLDSPIEVTEAEDGNQVKIMYLPYAVENMIKENIQEGQVEQDDIPFTPLVIKKTKNQGGWPSYDSSYFAREMITEEEMNVFEDFVVEQFDFNTIDIIPDPSTTEDVQAWLTKAEEIDEKNKTGAASEATNAPKSDTSPLEKMKAKKEAAQVSSSDAQVSSSDAQEELNPAQEADEPSSAGSSLRDRLSKLRK